MGGTKAHFCALGLETANSVRKEFEAERSRPVEDISIGLRCMPFEETVSTAAELRHVSFVSLSSLRIAIVTVKVRCVSSSHHRPLRILPSMKTGRQGKAVSGRQK